MPRITRNTALLEYARITAQRSTCLRRKVGAVIARDGRPIVAGYNGAPSGLPHCTPDTCNQDYPCVTTVHAEANCIAFAARHGLNVEGAVLVCTCSPCYDCAKLIINAGIAGVWYEEAYRDVAPLALLLQARVKLYQWAPFPQIFRPTLEINQE